MLESDYVSHYVGEVVIREVWNVVCSTVHKYYASMFQVTSHQPNMLNYEG
jgi:hypothetical protein